MNLTNLTNLTNATAPIINKYPAELSNWEKFLYSTDGYTFTIILEFMGGILFLLLIYLVFLKFWPIKDRVAY